MGLNAIVLLFWYVSPFMVAVGLVAGLGQKNNDEN